MAVVSEETGASQISREAGDKTKGFRFQKLRAAIRFLERIEANQDGQVQCAMELLEDSVIVDSTDTSLITGEENKFYTSGLSFNSSAIKNTVVAFLDLYLTYARLGELKLGVYASAGISGERLSIATKETLGIEEKVGDYSILKNLIQKKPLTEEELRAAYLLAKEEYLKQYPDSKKGWAAIVEDMSQTDFRKFIESIEWSISNETNESLEEQALEKVKNCRFFTHNHEGLEVYLLSGILDELEKRSLKKEISSRLLSTDTLKLIYNEILLGKSTSVRVADAASDSWDDVEISDYRNLSEKVISVCPDFDTRRLVALARQCSLARKVEPGGERELKALARRILDVAEGSLLDSNLPSKMAKEEVLKVLDDLSGISMQHVATFRSSYAYRARDAHSIKSVLLTLFDDCYLAFDEVSND